MSPKTLDQPRGAVSRHPLATALAAASALSCALALGSVQAFESGSDGSDGALEITEPGTYEFDPAEFEPPLDPDGDGVYHFSSITIGEGVTIKLRTPPMPGKAVYWLASGDVTIAGTLDLNGDDGIQTGNSSFTNLLDAHRAGPGGYPGGWGQSSYSQQSPGSGPGGGKVDGYSYSAYCNGHRGAGASHVGTGGHNTANKTYGNIYLTPLTGGSGGGGASCENAGHGGGAGGGAILIASSSAIDITGGIGANGGRGHDYYGGGGSGGSIRLMAPTITGNGALTANGGQGGWARSGDSYHGQYGNGSGGRIRVEAHDFLYTGTPSAAYWRRVSPGNLVLPGDDPNPPQLRVVSVGGVPVPPDSQGHFNPADLQIDVDEPVTFEIEAAYVPVGTEVQLGIYNETHGRKVFTSGPLEGTYESSTATASHDIPHGYSSFTLDAYWTEN